jgi:hypothetical protein
MDVLTPGKGKNGAFGVIFAPMDQEALVLDEFMAVMPMFQRGEMSST